MNNPNPRYSTRNLLDSFASGFSSSVSEGCCWLSSAETSVVLPSDYPEQAVQIQQSFYDTSPHESFSKADRFGLQRQHLCDEQQGSHEGEIFSGKACIFWWLSSSVLPERNGKEKATGKVESVWQLSMILNRRSQSSRNEDRLRLHEQSQPMANGIQQGTCWIHLLLDFQVQFLKIVADCHLLKHLLYSFTLPWTSSANPAKLLWHQPTWIL